MNWIKAAYYINLPIGTELLINTIHNGIKKVSVIENTTEFVVEEKIDIEDDDNTVEYGTVEYSHYCVITDPTQSNLMDLIKYRLTESERCLEKYKDRPNITYFDTRYSAASVNFGKIESLLLCLELVKKYG